tara:strand:+ start:203 stop:616 length:414 start_codon:yes stop_codon:yes gene_type:complete
MKRFKNIREQAGWYTPDHEMSSQKVDKSDVATKNAVSAAIQHELNSKNYMNPYSALTNLKIKLNTINLDFDLPEESEVSNVGSFSTTLRKATSDFGKKGDTPYDEWDKDDGSTGLNMKIDIRLDDETNLFKLKSTVT